MPCPICGNDGPNCDCSPVVRRMHADAEELLDRVAALEAAVPRWIPVAERLPDCGTWCWVWWAGLGHPFAAMRDKRAIGGWRNDGWEDWRKEVSHWMPLPPPPETPS